MKLLSRKLFESSQMYKTPEWTRDSQLSAQELGHLQDLLKDPKYLDRFNIDKKVQLLASHPAIKQSPFSNSELLQLLEYAIIKSNKRVYKYDFTKHTYHNQLPNSKYFDTIPATNIDLVKPTIANIKPKNF